MDGTVLVPLVENLALVGFAQPTPDQVEFTVASKTTGLPVLPELVNETLRLALVGAPAQVVRMVTTEFSPQETGVSATVAIKADTAVRVTGAELKDFVRQHGLIGYACIENNLEFSLAPNDRPENAALTLLPDAAVEALLEQLTDDTIVHRMVVSQLGSYGYGIAVSVFVPKDGQTVVAEQDRD